MKIGLEWPVFPGSVYEEDLQMPWRVISFATKRLWRILPCIEYVQGRFESPTALSFRVVIVQPAEYKFSARKEVKFDYYLPTNFLHAEGPYFSDKDVAKAGEGLIAAITHRLDQFARQVKDMSNDFEKFAQYSREADAISKD